MLWRAVFPWERRRGMWVTVAHVVVAPFGRCTFRDTFVGDVMTSLVKVFTDLAYTFCFLGTGEFLKLAPGNDSSISSDRCSDAPAYTQVFSPIIHAAPLVRCDRAVHAYTNSTLTRDCSGFACCRTFAGERWAGLNPRHVSVLNLVAGTVTLGIAFPTLQMLGSMHSPKLCRCMEFSIQTTQDQKAHLHATRFGLATAGDRLCTPVYYVCLQVAWAAIYFTSTL